jgi:hypothetical protein
MWYTTAVIQFFSSFFFPTIFFSHLFERIVFFPADGRRPENGTLAAFRRQELLSPTTALEYATKD